MLDAISSAHRDITWNVPDPSSTCTTTSSASSSAIPNAGTSNQATVLTAAMLGDDTDVSNACRRAEPGTFDAYVCDDRNLERLQDGALNLAKKAAWELVKGLAGVGGGK
jgi:hypothetical protein